ncbi:flavin reductase [Amycolatopsis coloradensis]|uniref:Flavin reductase n=1 Tax=Amycolatopsis coloradensis TaxID=76021 RepID=A0A1R0KQY3_9PSEU|nr:flavin reductase family protein [Amycolatopsis coloradensis]OLZ50059.1 flavin reductase [Amycolatopsis coloradensis]
MRAEIDPVRMDPQEVYRLLTAVVVPRPIAWVSTRSRAGVDNLAPHSFFTVSCADPPMVQFTSIAVKDSLRNVRETGEFVVNFATEDMFEQINATATDFPGDTSEFEAVAVTAENSATVAPFRVAESPVSLECELVHELGLGDSFVVIGQVRHIAVREEMFETDERGNSLPDVRRLRPLARLGRNEWAGIGEIRTITRIRHQDWPGHYAGREGTR